MNETGPDPLISIVIAVKNGRVYLPGCLESSIAQTLPGKELIVMDGASTDGTVDIIKEYSPHISHWESRPDGGIYHAWNKAIRLARGRWITFLGSDDYFKNNTVLEEAAPQLEAGYAQGKRYLYGDVALVSSATGRVIECGNSTVEQVTARIGSGDFVHHQGSFHHKELFTEWGLFDERYRIRGDFDLLLQPFTAGQAAYVPGLVVCASRTGGLSTSVSHLEAMKRETLDILGRRKPDIMPAGVYAQLFLCRLFGYVEMLVGRKRALVLADAYRLLRGRKRLYTV